MGNFLKFVCLVLTYYALSFENMIILAINQTSK